MDQKTFLDLAEVSLLKETGENFIKFFGDTRTEYDPDLNQAGNFLKREIQNPFSAILKGGQINTIANVTFHLMAQQIAMVLHTRQNVSKEKIFETTFENIRRLVVRYSQAMREEPEGSTKDKVE
jgi:hypothetical protein